MNTVIYREIGQLGNDGRKCVGRYIIDSEGIEVLTDKFTRGEWDYIEEARLKAVKEIWNKA